MNKLDLHLLPQITIDKPCPENWDAMVGDEQKRFCKGCGCHVHNLDELTPDAAEALLESPGRTCVRMTTDPKKGILTKKGWIPRLALAGALAASVAGCTETNTGEASIGKAVVVPESATSNKPKSPTVMTGAVDNDPPKVQTTLGEAGSIPTKPTKKLGK